jgi:hypothetical protein
MCLTWASNDAICCCVNLSGTCGAFFELTGGFTRQRHWQPLQLSSDCKWCNFQRDIIGSLMSCILGLLEIVWDQWTGNTWSVSVTNGEQFMISMALVARSLKKFWFQQLNPKHTRQKRMCSRKSFHTGGQEAWTNQSRSHTSIWNTIADGPEAA